ncbi:MAG: hypothetical protein HYS57_00290 [Parcubacteria group bacterium]|nr:hypothetical protein [Parcubacteria group bacterium]
MDELKQFLAELFRIAGFDVEEIKVEETIEGVRLNVLMPDAGLAIGENGAFLMAWEQVLRVYAPRLVAKPTHVTLDINNYRFQREETLREMAKKAARKAVLSKKSVELPAMTSYERRVVHMELALRPDVTTESEGEGPERKVVVKPISF